MVEALVSSSVEDLNSTNVSTFYNNLEYLYMEEAYSLDRIWNYDESGV